MQAHDQLKQAHGSLKNLENHNREYAERLLFTTENANYNLQQKVAFLEEEIQEQLKV